MDVDSALLNCSDKKTDLSKNWLSLILVISVW